MVARAPFQAMVIWSRMSFFLKFLLLQQLQIVNSGEVPLSQFPVYTQATAYVGSCVESWSGKLSVSYGCPDAPAACLCTDALKSQRAAWSIRSCASFLGSTNAYTATELWRSYCSINAGVYAVDETLVEDIPLFTRVTSGIAYCVPSNTAAFAQTFGCNDYTRAQCLCSAIDNYNSVQAAINSCLLYTSYRASASSLWSSYCDVNLNTPAQRSIGSPAMSISGIAKPVATATSSAHTTVATTGPGSSRTGSIATETSSSGGSTSNQSSTTTPNPISPAVITTITVISVAVCAFCALLLLRYRRRRLQNLHASQNNISRPAQSEASFFSHGNSFHGSQIPLTAASLHASSTYGHKSVVAPSDSVSNVGGNAGRNEFRNSMPVLPAPSVLSSGFGGPNLARRDGRFQ